MAARVAQPDYQEFHQRNLPHWQPPEATLFVTFRLDGSLPEAVLEEWRIEKKRLEMTLLRWAAVAPPGAPPDPEAVAAEKLTFQRRWFKKFEAVLDGATSGPLWLREERVAAIVAEALHHRDGSVYRLDAFCIMPNHVHAVFAPFLTEALAQALAAKAIRRRRVIGQQVLAADAEDETCAFVLSSIMESLKGWTARRCNEALGRQGQFWQHESYDRVIRDQAKWKRVVNYVVNNPVKVRLVANWQDWPWSYRRQAANEEDKETAMV